MKKQDLLKFINDEMLEKLFGFCYSRTNDSYEAEELCSEITFALVKAARSDGEIESVYPFIWKVAHNVYADFSNKRRKETDNRYEGDAGELLVNIPYKTDEDNADELLTSIYRRIAFLTKAYRDAMVMFYIDGYSIAEIAAEQNTSESNVRQRLFSARRIIRSEVDKMTENYNKPVSLDHIEFYIYGTGDPTWGDPRDGFIRQLSKHIVWLCMKKPMSAPELAEELNVPTVYVEEELEILKHGRNGEYGILRRLDNGKYAINIVLFDKETTEKACSVYTEHIPGMLDVVIDYLEKYEADYLSYPYLNKRVDMNLIIWQQISVLSEILWKKVELCLADKYFKGIDRAKRPFSVFGSVYDGKGYYYGCDGINSRNVCGFKYVFASNLYSSDANNPRLKAHFKCGHDISNDPQLQLALRSVNGLDIAALSEKEKEHAAKAIECGYLYRDKDVLYTKILVSLKKDEKDLFRISRSISLDNGYIENVAEAIAKKLSEIFKKALPDYLHNEWSFANLLAGGMMPGEMIERLIERGVITAPENGIGAEGCWMIVEK